MIFSKLMLIAVGAGVATALPVSPEAVAVCGEKRTAPEGTIPLPEIPELAWGLLEDSNPGAHPEEYQKICTDKDKYHLVKNAGRGGFSDFAVGQCNDPSGCPVYRVFDKAPDHGRRLEASACGHSWSPLQDLQGVNGAAKTLSKYLKDVGVCPYQYAAHPSDDPPEQASGGNKGGYLMKCTLRASHDFAFGQTQSADCLKEDGTPYTLEATAALQISPVDFSVLSDCSWCEMMDFDREAADAPNVLRCVDDAWTPIDCSSN